MSSSFSLDQGKVIAQIKGGKNNGDFIFVEDESEDQEKIREITLNEGEFLPVPGIQEDDVDALFITGPKGSGKTSFAIIYASQLKRCFPNMQTIIFTAVPSGSKMNKRIGLEEFADIYIDTNNEDISGYNVDVLAESICIFDDIDSTMDDKQRKLIHKLMEACVQVGRHKSIYTLYLNHIAMDYRNTSKILRESNKVIVFPQASDFRGVDALLKEYMKYPTDIIRKIANMKCNRWVMISKEVPTYVLSSYEAFLPRNKYQI